MKIDQILIKDIKSPVTTFSVLRSLLIETQKASCPKGHLIKMTFYESLLKLLVKCPFVNLHAKSKIH